MGKWYRLYGKIVKIWTVAFYAIVAHGVFGYFYYSKLINFLLATIPALITLGIFATQYLECDNGKKTVDIHFKQFLNLREMLIFAFIPIFSANFSFFYIFGKENISLSSIDMFKEDCNYTENRINEIIGD